MPGTAAKLASLPPPMDVSMILTGKLISRPASCAIPASIRAPGVGDMGGRSRVKVTVALVPATRGWAAKARSRAMTSGGSAGSV
jgi:hypothetical protein